MYSYDKVHGKETHFRSEWYAPKIGPAGPHVRYKSGWVYCASGGGGECQTDDPLYQHHP
jgi:hypothetical protein